MERKDSMSEIVLNKASWIVGERIGGGGFGQVFAATGYREQGSFVVKFVPKSPGAERELLFESLENAVNVVPIIDSGETENEYVLVMPRADYSLRDFLEGQGGKLSVSDAATVLGDVAQSLASIETKVVHRDIKPENTLFLDDKWQLADFGISRYAEATTSPDTKKFAMTPAYAAPERWRAQRATTATDVYALGVMGYELLAGETPFVGPTQEAFREQHLSGQVPELDSIPLALADLIDECLYKAPGARPRPANIEVRVAKISETTGPAIPSLAVANRKVVADRSEEQRQSQIAQERKERREELRNAADLGLKKFSRRLRDAIVESAPLVEFPRGADADYPGWFMRLGKAKLELTPMDYLASFSWEGSFEVIATCEIALLADADRYGHEGRSHSLWYCDAETEGDFGWFELAFVHNVMTNRRSAISPMALNAGHEAANALAPMMASYQMGWPVVKLDSESLPDFVNRWGGWFGDASVNGARMPTRSPERDVARSWR